MITAEMFFCCRVSLAEAHCKLSLRTRVLEEDAVIAVLLCENSITLKHGNFTQWMGFMKTHFCMNIAIFLILTKTS